MAKRVETVPGVFHIDGSIAQKIFNRVISIEGPFTKADAISGITTDPTVVPKQIGIAQEHGYVFEEHMLTSRETEFICTHRPSIHDQTMKMVKIGRRNPRIRAINSQPVRAFRKMHEPESADVASVFDARDGGLGIKFRSVVERGDTYDCVFDVDRLGQFSGTMSSDNAATIALSKPTLASLVFMADGSITMRVKSLGQEGGTTEIHCLGLKFSTTTSDTRPN